MIDEIQDCIIKLKSLSVNKEKIDEITNYGKQLIDMCLNEEVQIDDFRIRLTGFMATTSHVFINEIVK